MARERPTASDVSHIPAETHQELAEIIDRAAVLGVPEWRVRTALGMPTEDRQPLDEPPSTR